MSVKKNAKKKIVCISEKTLLSGIQRGELIAKVFVETPEKHHLEMLRTLILSFYDCCRTTTVSERANVAFAISFREVAAARNSDHLTEFLKKLYSALGKSSLEEIARLIYSYISNEDLAFVHRAVIFEHLISDFKLCVLFLSDERKLKREFKS